MANTREFKKKLWEDLYDAQCGLCIYSGEEMKKEISNDPYSASLDHIKPREQGGSTTPNNLILCCRKHNMNKNSEDLKKWWQRKYFFSKNRYMILSFYQLVPNLDLLNFLMSNYGKDQYPLEKSNDMLWMKIMSDIVKFYS